MAAAAGFRINYFRQVPTDVDTIKSFLNENIPVVVILSIGSGFTELGEGQVYDTAESAAGMAHAVLVVGYDDDLAAIKIMNTWGNDWADGGFGFIAYDIWATVDLEAYVVGNKLNTGETGAAETVFGKFHRSAQGADDSEGVINPLLDTDGDCYPDTLEAEFGLDPLTADPNPGCVPIADADADGWPDETEEIFGTDPESAADFPYNVGYSYPERFFDFEFGLDDDADQVLNDEDNCPDDANRFQEDADEDGLGDVCDDCDLGENVDSDGDGVFDPCDNCPEEANPDQEDTDQNGVGDACEEPIDLCKDVECPDDGLFCNGTEYCAADTGECESSGDPCGPEATCDEQMDACIADTAGRACCSVGGSCENGAEAACEAAGGRYLGGDAFCETILACPGVFAADVQENRMWRFREDTGAPVPMERLYGAADVEVTALAEVLGYSDDLPLLHGVTVAGGTSTLVTFNVNTGEVDSELGIIAEDPVPAVSGLAHDAAHDVLFAITITGLLMTTDQNTAGNLIVADFSAPVASLAWNPTDGLLYSVENLAGPDDAVLWIIDPDWPSYASPEATPVGTITDVTAITGLTFFDGELYGIRQSAGEDERHLIRFTDPQNSAAFESITELPNSTFNALGAWVGEAGTTLPPGDK